MAAPRHRVGSVSGGDMAADTRDGSCRVARGGPTREADTRSATLAVRRSPWRPNSGEFTPRRRARCALPTSRRPGGHGRRFTRERRRDEREQVVPKAMHPSRLHCFGVVRPRGGGPSGARSRAPRVRARRPRRGPGTAPSPGLLWMLRSRLRRQWSIQRDSLLGHRPQASELRKRPSPGSMVRCAGRPWVLFAVVLALLGEAGGRGVRDVLVEGSRHPREDSSSPRASTSSPSADLPASASEVANPQVTAHSASPRRALAEGSPSPRVVVAPGPRT